MRSSLMPFWKSTTTPSGALRLARPSWVAHSVSYDFTAMKTASKGAGRLWTSWMWSALTGMRCSPQVPLSLSPRVFMASTCSGH